MSVKNFAKYVVALVFVLLCAFGEPKDVMAASTGSCGTSSTWSYDNGTLTISGTGAVNDNPWITSYKTSITSVVIKEGITIPKNVVLCGGGGHCFENSGLKAATIADGATVVPTGIFANCTTLQTVNLPQSITKMDSYAFENCTGLTQLTLPWYLESIGSCAFKGCTNLKEITIYQKATKIDNLAFQNVTGLKIYGKANSTAQSFAKKNGYSFATCKVPALKGITYTKGNLKYKVPKNKYTPYKKLLTSKTGFAKKTMNIKK